jgi:hypothetical protein
MDEKILKIRIAVDPFNKNYWAESNGDPFSLSIIKTIVPNDFNEIESQDFPIVSEEIKVELTMNPFFETKYLL